MALLMFSLVTFERNPFTDSGDIVLTRFRSDTMTHARTDACTDGQPKA